MNPLIEQHRGRLLELCRKYDVRRLDLFGSAARGDFDSGASDLDFLVEFNNFTIHNAADRYFDLLFDLEVLFGRKVDLVSDKAIRNPYFRKSVDAERVNLYAA
jgi:predicted nucleotidyltransferase